jgi:hypothetical protein
MIQFIDKYHIVLDDSIKIIKSMLYLKLLEKDIRLTDNDLSVISLFTQYEDIKDVAKEAIKRNYKDSVRSVENTISDCVKKGILIKIGIGKRKIKTDILPEIKSNILAINCKIHNVKVN